MKAKNDCILCMFRQALNTVRQVTRDEEQQLEVLRRVARIAESPDMNQTPAALSQPVYQIVSDVTGVADPFVVQKRETNAAALKILPSLQSILASSSDPLNTALHIAVAGNIIDMGIGHAFNVERDIHAMLDTPFAIHALAEFRSEIRPGRRLLYLGDNAGEIVFDTVLVRYLVDAGMHVTYTVKSGPIINDATLQDACDVGMTELVPVIETGSNDIGVNWDRVSAEFRQTVSQADVILGKGHGNFETCIGRPGNFYFLLKAKCEVVAAELGIPLGSLVFAHSAVLR